MKFLSKNKQHPLLISPVLKQNNYYFSHVGVKNFIVKLGTFGTYLLFYFAYHPAINFSKFAVKGDFSYDVYLYAWPVQQLVMYYFTPNVSPISIFIISTVITLSVAYLSWHIIEKNSLSLKAA